MSDKCWEFIGINGTPCTETFGRGELVICRRYYHVMIINESESADVLRMCVETAEGFVLPILRELAEDREFLKNVEYSCKHMRKYHPEWFSEDEDVQD